jgi:hypothetical protein
MLDVFESSKSSSSWKEPVSLSMSSMEHRVDGTMSSECGDSLGEGGESGTRINSAICFL